MSSTRGVAGSTPTSSLSTGRISAATVAALVAQVVREIDGVVALDAEGGRCVTYGAGRRVAGVRARKPGESTELLVTVVAELGRPLPALAETIREAVLGELDRQLPQPQGWRVDVRFSDVKVPGA